MAVKFYSQLEQLHASLGEGAFKPENWAKYNRQYSDSLNTETKILKGIADAPARKAFLEKVAGLQGAIFGRLKERARENDLHISVETGEAPPSLASRVVKGLYNHSGKIAALAAAYLLAGQTAVGSQALSHVGKELVQYCEPVRQSLAQAATFLSDNRENITSALSGYATLTGAKKLWSKGWKKTAGLFLLAGTAATAAPQILKPGVVSPDTWAQANTAWAKTKDFASWAFNGGSAWVSSQVKRFQSGEMVKDAKEFLSTNKSNITSGITGLATLVGAKKLWSKGWKKLSSFVLLTGTGMAVAPHLFKLGMVSAETQAQLNAGWDKALSGVSSQVQRFRDGL